MKKEAKTRFVFTIREHNEVVESYVFSNEYQLMDFLVQKLSDSMPDNKIQNFIDDLYLSNGSSSMTFKNYNYEIFKAISKE